MQEFCCHVSEKRHFSLSFSCLCSSKNLNKAWNHGIVGKIYSLMEKAKFQAFLLYKTTEQYIFISTFLSVYTAGWEFGLCGGAHLYPLASVGV